MMQGSLPPSKYACEVSAGAGLSSFLSSDSDTAGFRPRVFHADLDQLFSNTGSKESLAMIFSLTQLA